MKTLLKQKSFYQSALVIAIAGTTAAVVTESLWFAASAVFFGLAQYNLQHSRA